MRSEGSIDCCVKESQIEYAAPCMFVEPITALEDGVIVSLRNYHWPGNVRELENTMERAVVLTTGNVITRDVVTVEARTMSVQTPGALSLKLHQDVEWIERETIRGALEMSTVKRQAARLLGISPGRWPTT